MKKLKSAFKDAFGVPIDQIIPLEKNLLPIDSQSDVAYLFGSPIAVENPYLIQGSIGHFIESSPEGYFLVGFWGHGANSYAFYYSFVNSWKKVFFRLPYGGVYMDNKKMAKYIIAFLTLYFKFEQKIEGKVSEFIAVESMYEGFYRIVMPDNNSLEFRESFFAEPEFEKNFYSILEE